MTEKAPMTYASTGVDYGAMDPLKRLAQQRAGQTSINLERFGMREVEASRGESAYVWDQGDSFGAKVIEGLGTKNLVADAVREFTGKSHYDAIAQDTVATIVNDVIVVGAQPLVIDAHWSTGSSDWFSDEARVRDLVDGWANACNMAGAVWGGGETPTLIGIINPGTIELSGSAVGIVKPKERLTLQDDKLTEGDAIFLVESSGIHANGLTLARTIADKIAKGIMIEKNIELEEALPLAYSTKLPDGKTYGESLLVPAHIYAGLVRDLFEAGIDIHYMVNITGHGWRKIMRAKRDFTYVIDKIPTPQPLFTFIQQQSGNDDKEMYGNFNMGAGFAIFMPQKDVALAQKIAKESHNLTTLNAGHIAEGKKQVLIGPKNIFWKADSLGVR